MLWVLRFVAVVLLSLSLGLHWAALQSAAWASMLLIRVKDGHVMETIRTTFDGKHPCRLCLVVHDGRTEDRQDPSTPARSGSHAPELDLSLASPPFRLTSDASVSRPPMIASFRFRSRSDPPPLRPPRSA